MTTRSIRPLIAGNWKMNGLLRDVGELRAIGHGFMSGLEAECEALVCVPATLIPKAHDIMVTSPVKVGGQDCHAEASGAHTGDISAEMIKEAGASWVIVGHSERRTDHAETDALVNAKARAAWRAGLTAIVCIGETRDQRDDGLTLDVLAAQIGGSIPEGATAKNTVVAYEPVWAIGTGLTPTTIDVGKAHQHIRSELEKALGEESHRMRILYGGSVKPANAAELLGIANVDGALIGGASLKAADFLAIAEAYYKL